MLVRVVHSTATAITSKPRTSKRVTLNRRDHDGDEDDDSCHNPERDVIIDETELGKYDVVCGRGKSSYIGNCRFRITISLSLPRWQRAWRRKDKSVVIQSVIDLVHGSGGRFWGCRAGEHQTTGKLYYQLSQKQSRLKVGHALRDLAFSESRSEASARRQSSRCNPPTPSVTEADCFSSDEDDDDEPLPWNGAERFTMPPRQRHLRRGSHDSMLGDSVFETMLQRVTETTESHQHSLSSLSLLLDDAEVAALEEGSSTTTQAAIPSTINVPSMVIPTDSIISTEAGRDSLDENILSWLIDESTSLLDLDGSH